MFMKVLLLLLSSSLFGLVAVQGQTVQLTAATFQQAVDDGPLFVVLVLLCLGVLGFISFFLFAGFLYALVWLVPISRFIRLSCHPYVFSP
jgi:hypothetical protein